MCKNIRYLSGFSFTPVYKMGTKKERSRRPPLSKPREKRNNINKKGGQKGKPLGCDPSTVLDVSAFRT